MSTETLLKVSPLMTSAADAKAWADEAERAPRLLLCPQDHHIHRQVVVQADGSARAHLQVKADADHHYHHMLHALGWQNVGGTPPQTERFCFYADDVFICRRALALLADNLPAGVKGTFHFHYDKQWVVTVDVPTHAAGHVGYPWSAAP